MSRISRLGMVLVLAGCSSTSGQSKDSNAAIDLSWKLRKGDRFTVEMTIKTTGYPQGVTECRCILSLNGEKTDLGISGELRMERLLMLQEEPGPMKLRFESGELKEYTAGRSDRFPQVLLDNLPKPVRVSVTYTGSMKPLSTGQDLQSLAYMIILYPLGGATLSGRPISSRDRWKGRIAVARSDHPELGYRTEGRPDGMVLVIGEITPVAQEGHRMNVSSRAVFDTEGGYVREGSIDIDFRPMDDDFRRRIDFRIQRN